VLVAVVLVQVTLTVVTVLVTIFISGVVIPNEDAVKFTPCDWKLACREFVKLDVSLTILTVASKNCSAASIGATIAKYIPHELELIRAKDSETSATTATDN